MESANYVQKFEDVPMILTAADISLMQRQATKYSDSFWRAIATASRDQIFIPARAQPDLTAVMATLSATLAFELLGENTVRQAQQMLGDDARLVWITELSDTTCVICRPLHGKTWRLDDPLILKPIENSHPNCKCRLLLADSQGNVLSS